MVHLRTWNDDRDSDMIVEKDRRLLAVEVKLATTALVIRIEG